MRTKQIIGLIVLGCVVASLGVLAVLITWLGPATGLIAGFLVAAGSIGTYVLVVGPWERRWGATEEEVRRAMPGDALLRENAPSTTRAVAIDAPPEVVFPWLLQIGYGRGGWYSYDWIDNDGSRAWSGSIRPSSGSPLVIASRCCRVSGRSFARSCPTITS
jgi:hypothetical protein